METVYSLCPIFRTIEQVQNRDIHVAVALLPKNEMEQRKSSEKKTISTSKRNGGGISNDKYLQNVHFVYSVHFCDENAIHKIMRDIMQYTKLYLIKYI